MVESSKASGNRKRRPRLDRKDQLKKGKALTRPSQGAPYIFFLECSAAREHDLLVFSGGRARADAFCCYSRRGAALILSVVHRRPSFFAHLFFLCLLLPSSFFFNPLSSFQIGNQFVSQYYTILAKQPHLLHRFYAESSTLAHTDDIDHDVNNGNGDKSESGGGGGTFTARGAKAIAERVASWGLRGAAAEIASVDSQYSAEGGVLIQVTGTLTSVVGDGSGGKGGSEAAATANGAGGGDNDGNAQATTTTTMTATGPPRKFCQAFFLAPQEKGYFVLNDIFRYLPAERTAAGAAAVAALALPQQQQATLADVVPAAVADAAGPSAPDSLSSAPPPSAEPEAEAEASEAPAPPPADAAAPVPPAAAAAPAAAAPADAPASAPSSSSEPAAPLSYAERLKRGAAAPPPPQAAAREAFSSSASASASDAATAPATPAGALALHAAAHASPSAAAAAAAASPSYSAASSAAATAQLQKKDEPPANTVIVRGMPPNATDASVRAFFEKFGAITNVAIRPSRPNPNVPPPRGGRGGGGATSHAFVEFEDPAAVPLSMAASVVMDGTHLVSVVERRPFLSRAVAAPAAGRGGGEGPRLGTRAGGGGGSDRGRGGAAASAGGGGAPRGPSRAGKARERERERRERVE